MGIIRKIIEFAGCEKKEVNVLGSRFKSDKEI